MQIDESKTICPHCGQKMKKWKTPDASTWGSPFQYICFNDECGYFVRGWDWTMKTVKANASYRHRYNPENGEIGPIPVWSYDALKSDIIED